MNFLNLKKAIRINGILLFVLCYFGAGCVSTPPPAPTATALPPTATATPLPTPTPTPIPPTYYLSQGDAALFENDFVRADEAYSQTLLADPQFALAYSHRAFLYALQPELRAASLELAQQAVDMAPESSEAWAYLSLVQTLNVHYADLPKAAKKAVALDEDSALAHIALAKAHLALYAVDDAQEAIATALEVEPDNVLALMTQADCDAALGKFDSAQLVATRAISQTPNFLPARLVLAEMYMRATEYPEAEAELDRVFEQNPDHLQALALSVHLDMARGDFNTASMTLRKLAGLAPELPLALSTRGAFYTQQDAAKIALDAFEKLIAVDPEHWHAYLGKGFAQLSVDSCEDAADTFHELLNLSPDAGEAHLGLALAMECQGEAERAEEGYRQAAELSAHDPTTLIGVAGHYFAEGDYEKAIENYRAALMQSVDDPDLYLALGYIHLYTEKYADAERTFKHILALESDNGDVWYGLAKAYFLQAEYQKTIETLEQMEKNTRVAFNGNPRALLGIAYCQVGDYRQAVRALQMATSEGATNLIAYLYLGRARRELGQVAQAAEAFTAYLDYNDAQLADNPKAFLTFTAQSLAEDAYHLREAEGVALARKTIQQILDYLDAGISLQKVALEDIESQRVMHLILEIEEFSEFDDETLAEFIGTMIVGVTSAVPRIEPWLDGGVWISLQNAAEESQIEVTAPYTLFLDLSDGLGWNSADTYGQIVIRDLRNISATISVADQIEEIKRNVEKERGLKPKQEVVFEMLTSETFRETLEDEYAGEQEDMHAMQDTWVLMGLLDPEVNLTQLFVDLRATQTAGFYNWEKDIMYVIGDEELLDPREELTFAHEYLHALQDQHYGLGQIQDVANDDQSMAFRSLAEGEATQFTIKYLQSYITELESWVMMNSSVQTLSEGWDVPGVLERMQIYPYEIGLEFVEAVAPGGYWPNIERTYTDPPVSTEQILHPDKYKGDERDDPQEVQLPEAVTVLSMTWTMLDNEVAGELWTREYLGEYISPDLAAVAAAGWDGDRYILLEHPDDGRDILIWQTVWDSNDDAWEFVTAHRLALTEERGYEEVERHIQPGERALRWKHENRSIYIQQQGVVTFLVFAAEAQDLDEVIPLLHEASH
ncbi:MAG TPA: tetratricopeptide repeat protein [Anaerolineae bacterium]|nr:tetratricopeptide repeat protein [Anaerolineae bacterium]